MRKFLVEDIRIGISAGGMACGPVPGHVVAEAQIRDMENGTVTWHSLAEVDGTLNFIKTDESTFETQIEENYDDEEAWQKVQDGEAGGYSDYDEFYKDLTAHETCDEDHAMIWKYLAYMVRADWDEVERMKAMSIGKCLGDFEIPVCDVEQEYLDEREDDTNPMADVLDEQDALQDIRAEYIGRQVDRGSFDLHADESLAGDYSFEESIADLKHQLEMAGQEKELAVQKAVAKAEAERNKAEATSNAAIAEKDKIIAQMREKANAADTERELAVKTTKEQLSADLQEKEAEIIRLKGQMDSREQTAKLQERMLKDQYEATLRLKDEEIKQIKDFKSKLSTKALGESLEKYCENQFNEIRTAAFPGAYFEKDNDAKSGSKGDYIFRENVDGVEILSIMFDMKTESDETATKHKNEDFLKELDKDRKEKNCKYAVLVSTLESENEYYNAGIQDVSFRYPKMYVVRPQQFITIISLLRNAALNSAEYQKELVAIKSQQLDLTHFEENMETFKSAFGRNYQLASNKLKDAADSIDRTINALMKIKENLLSSENQLRLANDKAQDLSIKRLTKGAPSVAKMLADVKEFSADNKDCANP